MRVETRSHMKEHLLTSTHPEWALTAHYLACLLFQRHRKDAAIAIAREALAIFEQSLDDKHPSVRNCPADLAEMEASPRT